MLEYQRLPHGYFIRSEPEPPHLLGYPELLQLTGGDETPVRRNADWDNRYTCRYGQPDRAAPRRHELAIVGAHGAFREDAHGLSLA